MDPAEVVSRRLFDAFATHDLPGCLALCTDDIVFDSTGPPPDGVAVRGKADVARAWQEVFEGGPAGAIIAEEAFGAGDRAVIRWRYDWGAGHVRGVDVFLVRDGLVAEKRSYVKG